MAGKLQQCLGMNWVGTAVRSRQFDNYFWRGVGERERGESEIG